MKYLLIIISITSFLFTESNNNASFTLSTGYSPVSMFETLGGIFSSLLLGVDSDFDIKGMNFNYKFHSNKRLQYGIFSSYQQLIETFYDGYGNEISNKKSHYFIGGPMIHFNWNKKQKLLDVSTNLGVSFIYVHRPDGYGKIPIIILPQIDLMSIHLGNKHSLNMNFGFGIQYLWSSIGYTYKL